MRHDRKIWPQIQPKYSEHKHIFFKSEYNTGPMIGSSYFGRGSKPNFGKDYEQFCFSLIFGIRTRPKISENSYGLGENWASNSYWAISCQGARTAFRFSVPRQNTVWQAQKWPTRIVAFSPSKLNIETLPTFGERSQFAKRDVPCVIRFEPWAVQQDKWYWTMNECYTLLPPVMDTCYRQYRL